VVERAHQVQAVGRTQEHVSWQGGESLDHLFDDSAVEGNPGPVADDLVRRELARYGRKLVSVPPSFAQLSVKDGQELGPCQLGEQHLILGVEAGADSVGFWLVNIVLCERGGVTEQHRQRSRRTASRSRTTSDDWRRARKAAYSGRI